MSNKKPASIWDKTWLSGAIGAAALLLSAFWFQSTNALKEGIQVFGTTISDSTHDSILTALLLAVAVTFFVELVRVSKVTGSSFIESEPDKNLNFYANCFVSYLQNVFLLLAIQMFYQTAGEYGFAHKSTFYKPWFECLALFIDMHLYLGLPYVILTRSLKANPDADKVRYGALVGKLALLIISRIPFFKDQKPDFGPADKQSFLALLLQMFFLPLIVIYFFKFFPQVVHSITYIKNGLPNSFTATAFQHATFNLDIARIVIGSLFCIHLVTLFTSYAMTSRWIQNSKQFVDTTLLSWLVCLVVYPPFHHMLITSWVDAMLSPQLEAPSRILAQIPNQTIVSVSIALMTLFYFLYIVSTLTLGKNYANLSYRNLVQTGIYSVVRHPSYATKLLGLTSIVLPLIGLNAFDENWLQALSLSAGLILGWVIFTVRALREEKLLKQHCPEYSDYCKKVPYRFIPRVI